MVQSFKQFPLSIVSNVSYLQDYDFQSFEVMYGYIRIVLAESLRCWFCESIYKIITRQTVSEVRLF